jgi:hypothetical protein
LTFDSIVSARAAGMVDIWNPARQSPIQTSLRKQNDKNGNKMSNSVLYSED